jgi:hypothetical protein
LSGLQKRFDEFAFAAHHHSGKSSEPFSFRHFRPGVQLFRQQTELVRGNVPAFDSFQQMLEQGVRQIAALNVGHG